MSVCIDEPAVRVSVNRNPSMTTSFAPMRINSPPAAGNSVASATRDRFGCTASVALLGEIPAFGPRSLMDLLIWIGADSV